VQGNDKWVAIAVETDAQWADLSNALEAPELAADPAFASPSKRWENRRALDATLSILTSKQDGITLCESLQAKKIAAMPLLGPAEMLENPHFQTRNTFLEIDHPIMGPEVLFGPMWRMTVNMHKDWCRAPLLGEHTLEVFSDLLGMSLAEVNQLIATEVLV
jgi:benzylsuccinate CoA-transferase BbsF subunit